MSPDNDWLTASELSDLSGVSRRMVTKAAGRALAGKSWNGMSLVVREGVARGGRSGVCYEVALSSLSEELQSRYRAMFGVEIALPALSAAPVRRPAPNQTAEIGRRLPIVQAIMAHPRGSAERAAEIAAQAKRHGRGFSGRTLRRWVSDHEAAGCSANSLARKLASDAGRQRVHVSRDFDRAFLAAGYTVDQLAPIGVEAVRLIKAAWVARSGRGGATWVKAEVSTALARECRQRGVPMPDDPRLISERRVGELRHYRIAGKYREDARWRHNNLPREKRDWSLLRPMDVVCADVKVWDNLVVRADGTLKTPAFIGFLDCATLRMFGRFYLLGKGEGIRQEHVTDAFLDMIQDEDWGFPVRLYLDNGSEFAKFEAIRESMSNINDLDGREIIYAKPYHGSSKPIESRFAWLQRYVSSQMGGYIGGDLGRPLTHQQGRRATPHFGSFDDFAREAFERIAVLEQRHVMRSGVFKGRTAASIYGDWRSTGWRPKMVPAAALDSAFHDRAVKKVYNRGVIKHGGDWTHPQLHDLFGQEVIVALPWRRGAAPLFKHPEHGWIGLQPQLPYHPLERDGADAGRRTQKAVGHAIRRLETDAGAIDLDQNHRDRVAALPAPPAQRELRLLQIYSAPEAEQMAEAQREAANRPAQELSEVERGKRRRKMILEAAEREYAQGR
jgi:hypothetical protein